MGFKPFSAVRVNGRLCLTDETGKAFDRIDNEDEYARIHNIMREEKIGILCAIAELLELGADYSEMYDLVFEGSPNQIMTDKDKAKAVEVWHNIWKEEIPEYENIPTGIPYDKCPICKEELTECQGHDTMVLDGSLLRQCSNGHIFANGRHPLETNPIDECVIDEEKGVFDSNYPGFKPLCSTGNTWKFLDGNWIQRRLING